MTAKIHQLIDYRAAATLPQALTSKPNWLVWRLVQKPGEKKPRKVPFYIDGKPRQGGQGTDEDRSRLASYERCVAACVKGHYTGIGFALMPGDDIVALDFDNCVVDGAIDPQISALVTGSYSEFSPSGTGIRAFFTGSLRSRKDNADAADRNSDGSRKDGLFDIEVFGTNGFVTITGDVTPDCELFGLEDTTARVTPAVMQVYRERFGDDGRTFAVSNGDADLLDLQTESLGWTLEEAREIIFACDSNCSRSQWLNALMALHHELGDTPEALDLADEWSSGANNYSGRDDVVGRWRSFGRASGAHITGKWLLKWRNESMAHLKYDAATEWKTKLQQATNEFEIREKLCPEITKDGRLDDLGREALAQMLRESFARLGNKYPIAQCRKLLAEKRVEKAAPDENKPEWLRDWMWVTDDDKFYRMDSEEWLTAQSFNAKYDRFQPRGDGGEIIQPANLAALRDHDIPTATRGLYVPWADRQFTWEGISCVNTYRPSSVPESAPVLTEDGKRAVQTVMQHLRLIANNRAEVVSVLLDWLAFQVQSPGVKVRWAPIIKGVEGDGKTVLADLLAAVMGHVNVGTVGPKVLNTDFTGWAMGTAVVVLEEIKLTGHNRHDTMNAVKPYITNTKIEVHPKGKASFTTMNTANYIAFTNFGDALPINDTDRRWFVVFTPWTTIEGLAALVESGRGGLGAYFNRLFDAIQQHTGELRRWLLDHPITDEFEPNGRAPLTAEKAVMVSLSVSEEEATVREILEKGGTGITVELFLSSYLNNEVVTSDSGLDLQTRTWSALLKRLGYRRLPKKVKWRGKTEIVWVMGHHDWELPEIKAKLAETLPEGVSEEDQGSESDLF